MHRVVALVGTISTLRLSICLVDLPHLDKLISRCRVKMTQIDYTFILIGFKVAIILSDNRTDYVNRLELHVSCKT